LYVFNSTRKTYKMQEKFFEKNKMKLSLQGRRKH